MLRIPIAIVHSASARPEASTQRSSKPSRASRWQRASFGLALLLAASSGILSQRIEAAGSWVAIAHAPPHGLDNPILMTDGTVLCSDGGSGYYKYTPDSSGNYANGTWATMASTTYTRLFNSVQVLQNGNVYVAGGEYGTGKGFAELYNYTANSWSVITNQPSGASYSDAISCMLPDGRILQGTTGKTCYFYDPSTNAITAAPSAKGSQNEVAWVRLPNDNILTIDINSVNAEHYVPSSNSWVSDNPTPTNIYGYGAETGAGFMLPNGKAFFIGGSSNTAIYTPGSSPSAAGSFVAGATIPNSLGAVDAPACMMNNGKILCALGPTGGFGSATSFYEYDYTNNTFTAVSAPGGGSTYGSAEFALAMLQLPDGGVFMIGGQGSSNCYIYRPDGSPLAQGQPTAQKITKNSDGSYHLTGVGLAGISVGAAYGDDWQMASNYPIIRLTNSSGTVKFGRSYNWTNTQVQNPNAVSADFTLPGGLAAGKYTLEVVVNGNPSPGSVFDTNGGTGTGLYEAEDLTINSSSDTVDNITGDSSYSDGAADILRATATGDSVVYLIPNVQAATYTVSVGMKKNGSRGTFQLSGSRADQNTYTNIGSPIDEYENTTGDYTEVTVGTWTPGTTNDKLFKFSVTGKNASSDQYWISVDYIRLTQGAAPVAQSQATPAAQPVVAKTVEAPRSKPVRRSSASTARPTRR